MCVCVCVCVGREGEGVRRVEGKSKNSIPVGYLKQAKKQAPAEIASLLTRAEC